MIMRKVTRIGGLAVAALLTATSAHALSVSTTTDTGTLTGALVGAGSGITVGTTTYTGAATQGGTYSGFNLSNGSDTVSIGGGVVLTSGNANGIDLPGATNNDSSFDAVLGTPGDADANAALTAAGYTGGDATTNDANVLEFSFSVGSGITSISADFVFGSEEFPDQNVVDIFAFIVDGVNYAKFSDGSLINFNQATSAGFFNDNDVGTSPQYTDANGDGFQYDGFTDVLKVTGLLDSNLAQHTLKIVLADTSDYSWDSGVFISNLTAGTGGGGIAPTVPIPAPAFLLIGALGVLGAMKRRRKA